MGGGLGPLSETGLANGVLTPNQVERFRIPLHAADISKG